MGCVNSVQAYFHGDHFHAHDNKHNLLHSSAAQSICLPSSPSVAQVQERVLTEMIRIRRASIRNSCLGSDKGLTSKDIAIDLMAEEHARSNPEIPLSEQECIVQALRTNVLFSCMHSDQLFALARFMVIQQVGPGEKVVDLGTIGEKFYVVRSGRFDVIDSNGQVLNRLMTGATFGEPGLLYNARRTANVVADAKTSGSLYALHGKLFRYVAAQHSITISESSIETLKRVKLLQQLTDEQLQLVANSVHELQYRAGDVIVHKGEPGSVMYMIQSGTVVCQDIGDGVGTAAVELNDGDYFGERALLASEPRAATVVAKTDVRAIALDQQTFSSLLGPLQQMLDFNQMWRALKCVAVMKTIPQSLKQKLLSSAQIVRYEPNQTILQEGDEGDMFFIIKEGEAKVLRALSSQPPAPEEIATSTHISTDAVAHIQDSSTCEVARIGPGDTFGEMAIINNTRRTASVVAITKVECFTLCRSSFDDIFVSAQLELQQQMAAREQMNRDKFFAQSIGSISNLERMHVIGMGSFGIVYIAKHRISGRIVAVKEMWKAQLEKSQQVHHIRSEKELLNLIQSPFLLKLYTTFQDEKKIYFVTEALLGGELFQRIVTPEGLPMSLPLSHARFYAACCIHGLGYLHERNIAYRDLKPENILLNSKGYAKLVDFGFAKKLSTGKTYTLCGTPEYLAPEVLLGVGHGVAADSWGVGILLYEMVIGESPFSCKDNDHLTICRNILQDHIHFPQNCDIHWETLVRSLLQKQPEKRASMVAGSVNDVRKESFFDDFDWSLLSRKAMDAPWKPELSCETDTKYFPIITKEDTQTFKSWHDTTSNTAWEEIWIVF